MIRAPRLIAILDQLIGPGARMIQDMALMKPPHRGAEKPWHQDNAYFDWTPLDGVLGVWIALDPATVENGCMQIAPGLAPRRGPRPTTTSATASWSTRRAAADGCGGRAAPAGRRALLLGAPPPRHAAEPERPTAGARSSSTTRRRAARRMTFREHMTHFDIGGAYVRLPGLGHGQGRVARQARTVMATTEGTR